MIIHFTKEEIKKCKNWAISIKKIKGEGNVFIKDFNKLTHYQSKKAEIAVAKVLGLEVNFEIFLNGGDNGIDLILPCGKTIDIKYIGKKFFGLKTNGFKKTFESDYGITVAPYFASKSMGEDCCHEIISFTTRDVFFEKSYERDFGYGNRWVIDQKDMKPFNEFSKEYLGREKVLSLI
jgi:hypothetical protein